MYSFSRCYKFSYHSYKNRFMDYASQIVLPKNGEIYSILNDAALKAKIVCFTGLPGVGKSLYVQQFAYLALNNNRNISILQWDGARLGFETDEVLQIYPEIDGVTHAGIRKSCGLWSRKAVIDWYKLHKEDNDVLILEAPLVGNRLVELGKFFEDDAEGILASEDTQFILPIPSDDIRKMIIGKREETSENPVHEMEKADAQPHVLTALYNEICAIGKKWDMANLLNENLPYDASFYEALYKKVLKARNVKSLYINQAFKVDSAYAIEEKFTKLKPSHEDVSHFVSIIKNKFSNDAELENAVQDWYLTK
ncbi:hypothetical protein N9Y48_00495 [Zobellia sp.]|nr:hypothetical protein [Zobellia sp.]